MFLLFPVSFHPVEEWAVHRRLIQPLFNVNAFEQYLDTFIGASNVLVRRLNDSPSQLNITNLVNQCVLDILNGKILHSTKLIETKRL